MNDLAARLADLRVIVCAGAGGVGKTTVSAALAVGLAAQGRRVALVTIDPARRLAEALALDDLGNQPQRVDPARFSKAGLEIDGELSAMMLDVKRTFDELIEVLAPDPRTREQILSNRIYAQLSTAVAGSQEYTAMAKLSQIVARDDFDAVVLDTPPSRSALDFLLAPRRLSAFLDSRALGLFLRPTGAAMRMAGLVFGAIRRIVGVGMLEDLTTFFGLLAGLMDGFRGRARDVEALLSAPTTGFVIVSSPGPAAIDEAVHLDHELRHLGLHRTATIVNRLAPVNSAPGEGREAKSRLRAGLGEDLSARVLSNYAEFQRLAGREQAELDRLRDALGPRDIFYLRDRSTDLHDTPGLVSLQAELFA